MLSKHLIISMFSMTCLSTLWADTALKTIPLNNVELSALHQAQLLGPMEPQQKITFTVWLELSNKQELERLVNELYDPASVNYQQFVTQEQYDNQYAPKATAIKAVEDYFRAQGMETKRKYSLLQVTGTIQTIERVLHTQINKYSYHNKKVYSNASVPRIDATIAPYVAGISNLSTIKYVHPRIRRQVTTPVMNSRKLSEPLRLMWHSFVPQALPTTTSLNGMSGKNILTAYSINAIAPVNGSALDGTGQTIVIIDGCGTSTPEHIMHDANRYNAANGLKPLTANNFKVVNYHGQPYVRGSMSCSGASGWDGEIALDVEASHTIAPGANIVLVMTDSAEYSQVAIALNTILQNQFSIGGFSNAYVISNSWGSDFEAQNEPLETTLLAAASRGLSFNVASGDCGDLTYNSSWTCSQAGTTPATQYPASSPYITAVGGTSLFVDTNYNYAFEAGWGNYVNGQPYSGSSGGISKWRSFPAWQAPISHFIAGGYGVIGTHNRAVPDLAMAADYYTGMIIYQGGSFYQTGGTSQATPLFSGILTLVNQARALLNGGMPKPIGFVAPYLYTQNQQLLTSKALHLITPPHQIISGATPVDNAPLGTTAPLSAFNITIGQDVVTFNWDGVLSVIENQFWNDVVGVGSPNPPNFVRVMSQL